MLLHDNVRPHTSAQTTKALRPEHENSATAPYSPDVAPSDYYLFWSMKTFLKRQIFYPSTNGYWNVLVAEKSPRELVCRRNATASKQMARIHPFGWRICGAYPYIGIRKILFTVDYTGFRGWGGGHGSNGEGTLLHWRTQKFRIFLNSKIFKKC